MFLRLLSTLVLVPLVVILVSFVPTPWVLAVAALFLLLAVLEWAGLGGISGLHRGFALLGFVALLLLEIDVLAPREGGFLAAMVALVMSAILIILLLLEVVSLPGLLLLGLGMLDLAAFWGMLRGFLAAGRTGRGGLLALLILVWVADTASYLVGKRWGRHPLAPRVSPGKTWEGAIGGLLATLLAIYFLDRFGPVPFRSVLLLLATGVFVWLSALLGDLAESHLKRRRGLKDSGRLIPGHGGILDRIDGLLAAAPVFYGFWYLKDLGRW